jgi:hypothetical protein
VVRGWVESGAQRWISVIADGAIVGVAEYADISPDQEYVGRPSVLSKSNPWALVVIER